MEATDTLLDKRLDAMDRRFDGIDKRLDAIEARLERVESRVGGLEQAVGRLDERMVSFEKTFATKADLHRELHMMSWRLFGGASALVAAVYGVVRYVH